ncbi:MAG: dihydroorotate dehydrogenase 1B [Methanobacterium sp. PtaU1.Bin242]|nr:MAG: dihydroorotate dehydrogenase 1B [Methanobacterium sp. PtaU1.Bin242]
MLETEICNIKMKNPTMLAAGVLGSTAASLNWAARNGAGAVVTKSFGLQPNKGYPNPTTVEVTGGFINAIGLSNPGVDSFKGEIEKLERSVPTVASIYGATPTEFSNVAAQVDDMVDMIELNVSCPHASGGCGASIGQDPVLTAEVVKAVKKTVESHVSVKLTPNVTDIVEIALNSQKAGCDALTLINSLGPGMRIDLETARPILHNKFGGLSGPAIKPIALRCVYDVFETVNVPIIGVGGIRDYKDVVEFLFAGASCVQIGTAIYYEGLDVFKNINNGLLKYMTRKGYHKTAEMVGEAH